MMIFFIIKKKAILLKFSLFFIFSVLSDLHQISLAVKLQKTEIF